MYTKQNSCSCAFVRSTNVTCGKQAVLVGCLQRLRVVRPAGLFELLSAIEVLRFELEHRPVVVVVDGMGSFFWQDKVSRCDAFVT